MKETEIIDEPDYSAREIIENGEKIAESVYKDIYRFQDQVLKVLNCERTNQMKRLGTYLPQNLMPETRARTTDLSGIKEYDEPHTVVFQERFDQRLDNLLEESQNYEELGELIYLIDEIVEDNAVISDPIVENFNYFDGKLKPNDICDIESVKKFPDSFELENAEAGFQEEVEEMYKEAIVSVNHRTDLSIEEAADIFEETSRHIRDIELMEEWYMDQVPEVRAFPISLS